MWMDYPGGKWRKNMDDIEKRFYCNECGHKFCLELDEYMPEPKFCIFCASPIFIRKDEEYDEDEFY